jgi:hypothetical protein
MVICRAGVLALLCLSGCADTHWERAFYEGQRKSVEQCRLAQAVPDPACPKLPAYEQYEKERAAVRGRATAP